MRNSSPAFVGLIGLTAIGVTVGTSQLLFSGSSWQDYSFGLNAILIAEALTVVTLVLVSSNQSAGLVLPVRTTVATMILLWLGAVLVTVVAFGGFGQDYPKLLRAMLLGETGIVVVSLLSLHFANRGATAGVVSESGLRIEASSTVSQWDTLLFDLENGECPEALLGEVRTVCKRIKFSSAIRDGAVRGVLEEAVSVIGEDPSADEAMLMAKKANALV
jgi:hypothetical protein